MPISTITIYSILSAIIIFSLGTVVVYFLDKNLLFAVKGEATTLVTMTVLLLIRLILPLDNKNAIVIQSHSILPTIQQFLGMEVVQHITAGMILLFVWGIGTLVVIIAASANAIRATRELKQQPVYTTPQIERVVSENFSGKNIKVVSSSTIEIPQVFGIIKAHIFLPQTDVFTDEELKMIISHEYWHIKGGDPLIKIFYLLVSAVFWWNPIVHIFRKKLKVLLEFRCDRNVVKHMSENERTIHLEAIYKALENYNSNKENSSYAISLFEVRNQKIIEQRCEMISNYRFYEKKKTGRIIIIVGLLLFISSYFVIWQPSFSPPSEDVGDVLDITSENAYLVHTDGKFELYVNEQYLGEILKKDIKEIPYSKLKIIEKGDSK